MELIKMVVIQTVKWQVSDHTGRAFSETRLVRFYKSTPIERDGNSIIKVSVQLHTEGNKGMFSAIIFCLQDNLQILRDLSLLQIQMRDLEGYRVSDAT